MQIFGRGKLRKMQKSEKVFKKGAGYYRPQECGRSAKYGAAVKKEKSAVGRLVWFIPVCR